MAESNDLDDFFAKKDKSKKKNKSKFTANDLLAEQGKDPKKEKKKKSKDKEKPQSAGNDTTQQKEDEEWVEIEETDYSGLRIQSLQSKQDEEVSETAEEPELNEDGEVIDKKDTNEGPWRKVDASQQPQQPPPRELNVTEVIEEASKLVVSADGKYVPPSQRRGGAAATPVRQGPRRKKVAPNIQSDLDFPSLGGAMEQSRMPGEPGQFERVRSGGRQTDESYGKSSQVELGNKYDALKN